MSASIWLRRTGISAALLLVGSVGWAQEHDHDHAGPSSAAEQQAIMPGLRILAVVLLGAIAVAIWYQLRKRALLKGGGQSYRD